MSFEENCLPFLQDNRSKLSSIWSCDVNGTLKDIRVSPKGVVAVGTEDTVLLYAGAPHFGNPFQLSVAPAKLTSFVFSANGEQLITGGSDGFLKWWEVHSGEESSSTQFPVSKPIGSGGGGDGDDETNSGSTGVGEPPAISFIMCSKVLEHLVVATGGKYVLLIF